MTGREECEGGTHLQGLMGPNGIVLLLPLPQRGGQAGQVEIAVVALPELLTSGAVESLHTAVERGGARRQHKDRNAIVRAALLELSHELRAAIDLDGPNGERKAIDQVVQKISGGAGGGPGTDREGGGPGDDIDGRELAQFLAGQGADVDRIDLDQVPGTLGLVAGWLADGMGACRSGTPHLYRSRFDQPPRALQAAQNAPHGGL